MDGCYALHGLRGVLCLDRGGLHELASEIGLAINGTRRRRDDFGP